MVVASDIAPVRKARRTWGTNMTYKSISSAIAIVLSASLIPIIPTGGACATDATHTYVGIGPVTVIHGATVRIDEWVWLDPYTQVAFANAYDVDGDCNTEFFTCGGGQADDPTNTGTFDPWCEGTFGNAPNVFIPKGFDGDWEFGIGGGFLPVSDGNEGCAPTIGHHGTTFTVTDIVSVITVSGFAGADGNLPCGDGGVNADDPADCIATFQGGATACGVGADGGYWVYIAAWASSGECASVDVDTVMPPGTTSGPTACGTAGVQPATTGTITTN